MEIGEDRGGQLALVEVAPSGRGEAPIGRGEVRARQVAKRGIARRRRRQAVRQEDRARAGELGKLGRRDGDRERGVPADRQPLVGDRNGWRDDLGERFAAEALEREAEPVDRAGHADRLVALEVAVALDEGPTEELAADAAGELVARGVERRSGDEAEIDDLDGTAGGIAVDEITGAAEPAHPWLDHAEGEGGGDRGIDCVAPGGENFSPGGGGAAMLGDDDPLGRDLGRFGRNPILPQVLDGAPRLPGHASPY